MVMTAIDAVMPTAMRTSTSVKPRRAHASDLLRLEHDEVGDDVERLDRRPALPGHGEPHLPDALLELLADAGEERLERRR